jgi:hypothetical protein
MLLKDTTINYSNLLFFSLAFILLIIFYYPFGGIDINHFHNDDYLLITRLAEIDSTDNFLKFLFSTQAYKIRPIANLLYFFEFKLFENNYNYYLLFNFLLFAVFISLLLNFFFQNFSFLIKFLILSIVITSKYYVYHLWNITGSFETFGLIIFILILKILFSYEDNQYTKNFLLILFAIILFFTNERYLLIILYLPFAQSIIHKKNLLDGLRPAKPYIVSLFVLGVFVIIRSVIGIPIFVGTQTSDIVKDFNLYLFLYHLMSSFFELYGFSTLPTYLSGYKEYFNIPISEWKFSYIWLHLIFSLIFLFNLSVTILFCKKNFTYLIFLFLILLTASVTFRLEMRWLAPAFVLILIFYSFTFTYFMNEKKHFKFLQKIDIKQSYLILAFLILFLLNNIYYVKHFRDSLYFGGLFDNQTIINKKR